MTTSRLQTAEFDNCCHQRAVFVYLNVREARECNAECDVQNALDEKLAAIEQNKVDLIVAVKKTSAKLRFTLNGSVARDLDYLTTELQTSQERLASLHAATDDALRVLGASTSECPEINVCHPCLCHSISIM